MQKKIQTRPQINGRASGTQPSSAAAAVHPAVNESARSAPPADQMLISPRGRCKRPARRAAEWKIVRLRETAPGEPPCNTSEKGVQYWKQHIATASHFSPEVESLAVLVLNTKLGVRGHYIVSTGTMCETSAHPREVFRAAIIGGAYAIIVMHNHPSGDPLPSAADDRITDLLRRGAETLDIVLLDHVIVGGMIITRMRTHGPRARRSARRSRSGARSGPGPSPPA